jgi:hypothetical protein
VRASPSKARQAARKNASSSLVSGNAKRPKSGVTKRPRSGVTKRPR